MKQEAENFYFDTSDGQRIFVKHWHAAGDHADGTIFIAHGLGETADYYDEFSDRASALGFDVVIPELRGHGRTAGDVNSATYSLSGGNPGANSLHKMAEDLHVLTDKAEKDNPGKPVFLLGHSMGSVVAQLFAFTYGKQLNGLLLTGVPSVENAPDLLKLIDTEISERGRKAPCRDTFHAMFDSVNKPFDPVKTELDWITSDEESIRQSLELPYTSILFNNEFYRDFLVALTETAAPDGWNNVPKELPVTLLCGGSDVMTQNGKRIIERVTELRALGIRDVQFNIYPNLRHSILRERGRVEVMDDILRWIQLRLKNGKC